MEYRYFDVHSHIAGDEFDHDRDELVASMQEQGIGTITVGSNLESSKKAVECAQKYGNVFASVGLHPHEVGREIFSEEVYRALLQYPKVVALGECGLDYFQPRFDVDLQREPFRRQIALAVASDKPLMLHGRPSKGTMDAYEAMLKDLAVAKAKYGDRLRGNVHFFVGDPEIASRFCGLGFTLSLSGVITFAPEYEAVVGEVPLSMLHAETDSPYATPVPHRGVRNDPRYVELIVSRIAHIKNLPEKEVQVALVKNAGRVFGVLG